MKRWPVKSLGELVNFVGGGTPRRDRPDYWGGAIPWASVKDLQSQSLETTLESITAEGLAHSASHLIPKDTVIIASRVGLGKVAINRKPVAINQDLKALTPQSADLLPRYLLLFLLSKVKYFESAGVGSTVKGLTIADYQKLKIVLPHLAEQERIVNLMDDADALRKLRAAADHRTADLIPALFNEMFGDPATNPMRWKEGTLGDVIHAAQDGPHVSPRYAESGIPFLSARHIKPGRVVWSDLKYLSRPDAESQWKKCKPERGDVLYTKGGTTGVAAAIDFDTEIAVWVHIALLKTNRKKIDPIWLESMLNSEFCYKQAQQLTHGIANRDLGLTRMIRIQLFVPPLALQKEFAGRVTKVRELEAGQITSRQRLDDLVQSMLYGAFSGGL